MINVLFVRYYNTNEDVNKLTKSLCKLNAKTLNIQPQKIVSNGSAYGK